jgi:adenylate cyclase
VDREPASRARFQRYLPDTARDLALSADRPLTRESVTMFADIAGFTSLSENLARFGTAGTEQVGGIVRRAIGGALDIVRTHGGDALAFGGDAITVEFAADTGWADAERAAADIIDLFEAVTGTQTLAGPVELSVRIGISAGRVSTLLCLGGQRDVLVQLGPGLDRAAESSGLADRNAVHVMPIEDRVTATRELGPAVPVWAPRLFHPLTSSRIAAAAEPPDEHRRVTCVFLSLPPTDDRDRQSLQALSTLVASAADAITDSGGDVVQCSGGDKGIVLFAVFGAPVAHADDPLRAVHAVDLLRSKTSQPFAAGISTGLGFTAVFGGRHRGFPSVIGDTTNVAARLMAAAEPGTTLLDERTTAAGVGRLVVDAPRALTVKNRAEPIPVVRFRELSRSSRGLDDEGETPFVGRDAELAAGERLLDTAVHHGSALHLVGDAGSGKSRLAGELARRARIRGLAVRTGGFEAFGMSSPLGPFAHFVRDRPGLSPLKTQRDLWAAVAEVRPGDEGLAPLLGPLIGVSVPETNATIGLSDDQRADLGRRLVVDLLCAAPTPTLFVVEDVHWADEASRSLLAELGPRLRGSSVSLVTTRRPGPVPGCDPSLALGDLPRERLATIVRDTWSRLGGSELPDEYVAVLVERAAGSPMFAQTVTELVRRGYQPGVPLPEVPLPDQLLPFLTAQIDTLGDSAQRTALEAAILGRPVSADELARVFAASAAEVRSDVVRLAAGGSCVRSVRPTTRSWRCATPPSPRPWWRARRTPSGSRCTSASAGIWSPPKPRRARSPATWSTVTSSSSSRRGTGPRVKRRRQPGHSMRHATGPSSRWLPPPTAGAPTLSPSPSSSNSSATSPTLPSD